MHARDDEGFGSKNASWEFCMVWTNNSLHHNHEGIVMGKLCDSGVDNRILATEVTWRRKLEIMESRLLTPAKAYRQLTSVSIRFLILVLHVQILKAYISRCRLWRNIHISTMLILTLPLAIILLVRPYTTPQHVPQN